MPEGIVAAKSAATASVGGALVPLLAMGIPGSGATAIILAAFLLHGMGRSEAAQVNDPATTAVKANAATLVRAGVPVALASFGGQSGATFRDRVRASIEAGLSPDEALRATTVTPAAVLGISGSVGTIEVGKLANLVVVSGNDLFASGTPIKHVFVEGRLY